MVEATGSSVPRRHLGRVLRELRIEACMTLDAAAEALECSRHKMWRIESGLGMVRAVDVRAMCELYGARRALTAALVALAGETRGRGWWHAYGDPVPEWFDLYGGLESAASRLREHAGALVPALLQTPAYAAATCPHRPGATGEEREQPVEARLRRQDLLRRRLPRPPRYEVLLAEAVLLRQVGGAAVTAGQLRHLAEASLLPQVSIRVLPLAAGAHDAALTGSFVLLEFPLGLRADPDPPVVYQESLTGALYLDRPAEWAAYEQVWAGLDGVALDEEESRRLILTIGEELHPG
ncbi:helix-turn-helix domain-containing protein [Micromonospora wenchangensis]|uniref:helix-turn-helix domain-containing protein n=1 Tax=Micromonospora wenchangensis TaxID=1185415 RepID=UPI00343F7A80